MRNAPQPEGREEVNHYIDPYEIRARNEQVRREVQSLRLEGRLRKNSDPGGSRVAALILRGRPGARSMLVRGPKALSLLLGFALAAGVLVLALITTAAKPAKAVFPGANGAIAFNGGGAMYRMAPDGFGGAYSSRLTESNSDYLPAWNAEGTRIAFVSYRDATVEEIYRMDASGNDEIRLTNNSSIDTEPAWFPTDTRLAFTSDRPDTQATTDYDIYTMTLDESGSPTGTRQITTSKALDSQPAVSPDGKMIAFLSNRDGDYEIYVMKARPESQTNRPVKLTNNSVSDQHPDWSPDGRRIVFDSERSGNASEGEIVVMNADGSGQKLLTNNAFDDRNPVFSPDGRRIAFESARTGSYPDIYRMGADGANPFNLTSDDTRGDFCPSWQPL